jgi:two-component SAPR family response regulator
VIEGLRTAYEILLSSASRGEVLRYFYPYDDYHEIASPFYSRLYQFQKSKGLEERGISSTKFKQSKHYKEIPKDVDHNMDQPHRILGNFQKNS